MIAIINYGAGNLSSVKNALDFLGIESRITNNPKDIDVAERIILPGVGSFGYVMSKLKENNLDIAIKSALLKGKPFLGICLGYQILFESSEESPGVKGLSLFKGKVMKFRQGKVPQVGWNVINPIKNINENKQNIFKEGYVYFTNSYYPVPVDKDIVATKTGYYEDYASAIQFRNITAVQFHPEKSGKFGMELLNRWLEC